ncbi:MAG: VIT family protein [Acidimicrobiales bacterium]|nr:VIT family protein [Acidimicrobiales bacterium]
MPSSQPLRIHQHRERHAATRTGWLRASVLGANDGIVSTAALVLGVAAADVSRGTVFTAGLAALVAGASSMAVGEYVSVSSQRDAEQADIARERHELATIPDRELDELTGIYIKKGLSPEFAREVAIELSKGDVLAVHLAEELGITELTRARPVQAAVTSAVSFAIGAALPLLAITLAPLSARIAVTFAAALVALATLGFTGARLGGAPTGPAVFRTLVGGIAAMVITMAIGHWVGAAAI